MTQYRQGDVLVESVATVPPGAVAVARKDGRLVLAEGESTGHAHAIASRRAQMLERAGVLYLVLLARARLLHEEHGPITLPPGTYRVIRQREYHPEEIRLVAD
jgi:hypothetical protein